MVPSELSKSLASIKVADTHVGNGVLISRKHILSTAQCLLAINDLLSCGYREVKVVIGGYEYDVRNIDYHPFYNPYHSDLKSLFDFGLILVINNHRAFKSLSNP